MVLLLQAKHHTRPVPWAKSVAYERERDIYSLIAYGSDTATALRPEAKPFVPMAAQLPPPNHPVEEEVEDVDTQDEHDTGQVDENALEDAPADIDAAALTVEPTNDQKSFSDEHIAAVKLFQRVYRRTQSKRQASCHGGLAAERRKHWDLCEAASHRTEWPHKSSYKLLFLGPLAHILLCLDGAISYAHASKKAMKRRLTGRGEKHHGLEDTMARHTEVRYFTYIT
jgi:hypothetical protein